MPLGNEPVVSELEMLTRMDDENVLHGKESLEDYTQLDQLTQLSLMSGNTWLARCGNKSCNCATSEGSRG